MCNGEQQHLHEAAVPDCVVGNILACITPLQPCTQAAMRTGAGQKRPLQSTLPKGSVWQRLASGHAHKKRRSGRRPCIGGGSTDLTQLQADKLAKLTSINAAQKYTSTVQDAIALRWVKRMSLLGLEHHKHMTRFGISSQ